MRIKTGILFGGSSRHREKSFMGAQCINLHLPVYSMEKILIWIDKEGKLFHVKESCFVSGNVTDHLIKEIDPSTLGQYINIAIVTLSIRLARCLHSNSRRQSQRRCRSARAIPCRPSYKSIC